MLTKVPQNMSLEEINEELEFLAIDRVFTKVADARNFLTKLIHKGDVIMTKAVAKELGVQEAKQDNKKKEAKAKAEKPKAVKPVYNFSNDKWNNHQVFCSGGKAVITGYDEDAKRFQVKLEDGTIKDYAESAVRFKAVDDSYREKYVHDRTVRTESGSISIHKGDEISRAMLGLTEAEVRSLANENGLEENYNKWVERDLNTGMKRMNTGNMLRAKHKRGEKVTIFGREDLVEAAELREAQMANEAKEKEKRAAEARKAREAKLEASRKKKEEEKAAKAAKAAEAKAAKKAKKEIKTK